MEKGDQILFGSADLNYSKNVRLSWKNMKFFQIHKTRNFCPTKEEIITEVLGLGGKHF